MVRFLSKVLTWSWVAIAFIGEATPLLAEQRVEASPILSVPKGLEPDVRFWEMIFSKFEPDHCVFHDKDDLRMVYLAKRIQKSSALGEERTIRRYIGALRLAFWNLANGSNPQNLIEKRIFDVTPPARRNRETFRTAMDNIRCQRGIDLTPSLQRSRTHIQMVQRILSRKGLPGDLAYLPHLESGYNVRAHSRAGARGIWQLMPGTARLMGLRVGRHFDERTDAVRATHAASELLLGLYRDTGDWPLAITAYNYGQNGMARAIKLHGRDYFAVRNRHKSPLFGFAARNYYPSFLAVRNVAQASEKMSQAGVAIR